MKNDYYSVENYALCLNMKISDRQKLGREDTFKIEACKTRNNIIVSLENIISRSDIDEQENKVIFTTLSNCYFGLGNKIDALFKQKEP